nr:squalene/phytoene synthase family protein [Lautropia sp.]
LQACGVDEATFADEVGRRSFSAATRRAVAVESRRAREQLLAGRPLVERVPVRLGWELRFIIGGALQILDRLRAIDHDVAAARPRLGWRDAPALLHKALTLSRQQPDR